MFTEIFLIVCAVTVGATQQSIICLSNVAAVSQGCAVGDNGRPSDMDGCCEVLAIFNADGCYCTPASIAAGGESLQALKPLVAMCGATLIDSGSDECPSMSNDLQCELPGKTLAALGLPVPPVDTLFPAPDEVIDAWRLGSLKAFAEVFKWDQPDAYYIAVFNNLFTEESTWELVEAGVYVGPKDIFEYAKVTDPKFNTVMGLASQISSAADPNSFTMEVDKMTYTTIGEYCVGFEEGSVGIEEGGTNCGLYDKGKSYYDVEFLPCSNKFKKMKTNTNEGALSSFYESSDSIFRTCRLIMDSCVGEYQQYENVQDCFEYLNPRPARACTGLGYMGPSKACVFLHTMLAIQEPNHCFHVGKGLPDKNGKVKCGVADCVNGFTDEYKLTQGQCTFPTPAPTTPPKSFVPEKCERHLKWALNWGKSHPHYYRSLEKKTGATVADATYEDYQRWFKCTKTWPWDCVDRGLEFPNTCSHPPCDSCSAGQEGEPRCESWCERNWKPWIVKCALHSHDCEGCSQCEDL